MRVLRWAIGWIFGGLPVTISHTPASRMMVIEADSRVVEIAAHGRALDIATESRILVAE